MKGRMIGWGHDLWIKVLAYIGAPDQVNYVEPYSFIRQGRSARAVRLADNAEFSSVF